MAVFVALSSAFKPLLRQGGTRLSTACFAGPRPLHKEFTVEKATPELMEELNVKRYHTQPHTFTDAYHPPLYIVLYAVGHLKLPYSQAPHPCVIHEQNVRK